MSNPPADIREEIQAFIINGIDNRDRQADNSRACQTIFDFLNMILCRLRVMSKKLSRRSAAKSVNPLPRNPDGAQSLSTEGVRRNPDPFGF
jgi:hypothetical protein